LFFEKLLQFFAEDGALLGDWYFFALLKHKNTSPRNMRLRGGATLEFAVACNFREASLQ